MCGAHLIEIAALGRKKAPSRRERHRLAKTYFIKSKQKLPPAKAQSVSVGLFGVEVIKHNKAARRGTTRASFPTNQNRPYPLTCKDLCPHRAAATDCPYQLSTFHSLRYNNSKTNKEPSHEKTTAVPGMGHPAGYPKPHRQDVSRRSRKGHCKKQRVPVTFQEKEVLSGGGQTVLSEHLKCSSMPEDNAILLALATGLRIKDIDLKAGVLRVRKNGR